MSNTEKEREPDTAENGIPQSSSWYATSSTSYRSKLARPDSSFAWLEIPVGRQTCALHPARAVDGRSPPDRRQHHSRAEMLQKIYKRPLYIRAL